MKAEEKITAEEQYIIKNYGESWMINDWVAGDVKTALKEYFNLKSKELLLEAIKEIEEFQVGIMNNAELHVLYTMIQILKSKIK